MNNITNLSEIHNLCRICLTKSTSMIPLKAQLHKETSNTSPPSILEALEKVMGVKVVLNEKYPSSICAMCKGLLKISYDLNSVFCVSQTALIKHFNDDLIKKDMELDSQKVVAPVELIFGDNKYDLKDVVIIEEEENENKQNFQGFLNNLGKTVSAVFVNKQNITEQVNNSLGATNTNEKKRKVQAGTIISKSDSVIEISLQDVEVEAKSTDHLLSGNNVFDFIIENNLTESAQTLLNHFDNHCYINKEALKKIYKCSSCNILCASRSRLKIHLKKYHAHEIPYFCEVCGSTSFNDSSNPESEQKQNIISCDDCGSVDTKMRILGGKKLNFVKNLKQDYLCQVCGFISKSARNARYHQQKHLEARYQCKICNKKYHNKTSLKWHINCHQNIRNQLCTICGKRFNYYSALVYHMRIHTNERNYCCNFCDKRFYMPTALKRHIRTHTGIRPYNCRCCGKGFFSIGERQKHEMIHTGQRPYKCQYCNKGFISSFNRKVHSMSHSGPHGCDYCPKTFIDTEFLKMHVNAKHKNIDD